MNVGDRVKLLQTFTGFGRRAYGETGVVTNLDTFDDSSLVKFDSDGDTQWVYNARLELVAPDPVAQARKLLEDAGYQIKALEVHKDVAFRAGDVVDYRFSTNGTWYTYVRGSGATWGNNVTDRDVNRALQTGHARMLLQADENDRGASVPFDTKRLS